MIKVINEEDVKKATEVEKCEMILAIIKRTSSIYARYKNTLKGCKNE